MNAEDLHNFALLEQKKALQAVLKVATSAVSERTGQLERQHPVFTSPERECFLFSLHGKLSEAKRFVDAINKLIEQGELL